MIRQALRLGLVLSVVALAGSSADDEPPVKCNKRNSGAYWPEAANTDYTVRHRAERCGTLRYCARTTFGWHWQALTVSVQSMMEKASGQQHAADAACAAETETTTASQSANQSAKAESPRQ